jgi:hypothetical protein
MILENLNMLRGRDIEICDGITIRQPTLGDIEELGEDKYFSTISTFTATPFDIIAQLDEMGIDFTEITSYQLFCVIYKFMDKSCTDLLFTDLDFSKFIMVDHEGELELRYRDLVINERTYNDLVDYIRKIHMIPPPQYTQVANEYTKHQMIELAYSELEFNKRRKKKSFLKTYISRVTNHPYFKYRLDEVWDLKVYAFFDAVKSISIVESSCNLSMGAYSGNLDLSKINKQEFNWLRETD